MRDTLCFVRDTLCVVETAKAPGIRLRDAAHAVTGLFALQQPLGRGRGRGRSRARGGGAGPCRYSLGVFRNCQQVIPPPPLLLPLLVSLLYTTGGLLSIRPCGVVADRERA
jgi:hypothetical protein